MPDELELPKPRPELHLPKGLHYLSWQGNEHACITKDKRVTLCGEWSPRDSRILSGEPMGKRRCMKCLIIANIRPQPDEMPVKPSVPSSPLPPEFYKGTKHGQ